MEKWVVHSVNTAGFKEKIVCKTEAQAETVADILQAHGSEIAGVKLEYGPVRLIGIDPFWAYALLAIVVVMLLSGALGYGAISVLGEMLLALIAVATGVAFVFAFFQVKVPE